MPATICANEPLASRRTSPWSSSASGRRRFERRSRFRRLLESDHDLDRAVGGLEGVADSDRLVVGRLVVGVPIDQRRAEVAGGESATTGEDRYRKRRRQH
ncbi:hypothetical protein [Haloterrigena salifodinae]|uniref:hypothetical protein n=1 Tax=Haloterrigena salifodinae TaxID=2675099 RepID=UPI001E398C6D|nr:hypothetical protein [Haloterrigena salifodinae]